MQRCSETIWSDANCSPAADAKTHFHAARLTSLLCGPMNMHISPSCSVHRLYIVMMSQMINIFLAQGKLSKYKTSMDTKTFQQKESELTSVGV